MAEIIKKSLGDITSLITKGIAPKYVDEIANNTIVVLNQKCNRDFCISLEYSRFNDCARKPVPAEKMLRPFDVLINSTGTGTAGRVAQLFDIDQPMTLDGHMILLRPTEGIDPLYYGYAIKAHQGEIEMLAEGSTGQTEINRKRLCSEITISYPPSIVEQKRISKLLYEIDLKIWNNNAINDNLEQQARALYQSIIDGASQSAVLSDFVSIKHGYAFKGDYITFESNNVVLVTPGNFKIGGGFQENKCKYFTSEYPNDYVLCPGNLIVTMTDLSKEADTLGYSALVPDNPERIYLHNQRIGLVQFTNSCLPKDYVYWFLRSYAYHMRIVGSASGSTVKHTSPGRILEQIIPIPQDREEPKLRLLKDINETIAQNELESNKLSHMRNIILPRLMSGELDISALDL